MDVALSSLTNKPLVFEGNRYRIASGAEFSQHRREFEELEKQLQGVKDKQGAIGNLWDDVKSVVGVGTNEVKCDSMLEKFNSGEISFTQAAEYIGEYDKKQDDATELISNIVTGTAAIAATTIAGVMGGPLLPILAIGAGIGAVVKTGFKLFDRATNKVENDEFNAKVMAKDFISGAVTGATSAVPSGISKGIEAGDKLLAVENGIKCGVACGAISGSISYMTDVVLDDRNFDLEELAKTAGTSAFVSGTVSAGVGAGLYHLADLNGTIGKKVTKSTAQTIISDSASSSARKILGKVERNIIAA